MPGELQERLQKILAQAGVASRRRAEELIQAGRVTVNGRIVTQLGTRVNPASDDVRVDGQRVKVVGHHVYLLLNKPRGVVSSMEDPRGHKALGDLVQVSQRVFPVGRLDANSEGLILLTDDGELANLLTHPRYEHEKEYRVLVNGTPSDETLDAWRRGVVLEGEHTAPARVDTLGKDKDSTWLRVIMHEGRKRQLREVAALLGHPVRQLQRVRLGPLHLGVLKPGEWRHLTETELEQLTTVKRKAAGGKPQAAGGEKRGAAGRKMAGGEPPAFGPGQVAGDKKPETAQPTRGRARPEADQKVRLDRKRKPRPAPPSPSTPVKPVEERARRQEKRKRPGKGKKDAQR